MGETPLKSLDMELVLTLSSSGFKIVPDKPIKHSKRTNLPISHAWTITPLDEGEHLLILKLDKVPSAPHKWTAVINDVPTATTEGVFQLPIVVYTIWGYSERVVQLVYGVAGVIGFFLMWPLFIGRFTKAKL
jgi:hypothetical protein